MAGVGRDEHPRVERRDGDASRRRPGAMANAVPHSFGASGSPEEPRFGTEDCTPEIDTSEIIVQWMFNGIFQWMMDVHVCDFWCLIFCPDRSDPRNNQLFGLAQRGVQ